MKLEALKAIITDLNLAGIYDIPGNSLMDKNLIESNELIKSIFEENNIDFTNIDTESFDESNIASEVSELFAAFGSGKAPQLGNDDIEVIKTINTKPKTVKKVKQEIIDPRLKEAKKQETTPKQPVKELPKIIATDFITKKNEENSKFILLLPYKDKKELEKTPSFTLLNNILKAVDTTFEETSIIFVDNSYKNITQDSSNYDQTIAKQLSEDLKCFKQDFILCFGQDCLNLAKPEVNSIRDVQNKVLDVFENKKLLANYSLSAMVNTPKYKRITWANLLLIIKLNKI